MQNFYTTNPCVIVPHHLVTCSSLVHSAKGSSWKDHKYIKRVNGTYYYPASYEGGRHLDDETSKSTDDTKSGDSEEKEPVGALETTADLKEEDIEALAREVIRGNFGNGQERKDLLGDAYQKIQDRVNKILLGDSAGNKKVSSATDSDKQKADAAAKKLASAAAKEVAKAAKRSAERATSKVKKEVLLSSTRKDTM